ncbi:MAG: hypothetical protein MZW92_25030 [Comamonadaceae bacterium]|nr:hypothetical protein [Comamonadaceae bacterium]
MPLISGLDVDLIAAPRARRLRSRTCIGARRTAAAGCLRPSSLRSRGRVRWHSSRCSAPRPPARSSCSPRPRAASSRSSTQGRRRTRRDHRRAGARRARRACRPRSTRRRRS